MERLFDDLCKQFKSLAIFCRLYHFHGIETVPHACCKLHIIIADYCGFKGTKRFQHAMTETVVERSSILERILKKMLADTNK